MQYFRYKLKLSQTQKTVLNQWIGSCRCLYNIALEQRQMIDYKEVKARGEFSVNYNYQSAELKILKNEFPWFKDVPSQALQQTLMNLDQGFKRFFKGLGGFPTRKKKHNPFGIKFPQGFSFEDHSNPKKGYIKLPKIGKLRYFKSRELEGKIKSVTLRKEGSDYFISVLCDIGDKYDDIKNSSNSIIGVDRGISKTLALSDGTEFNLDVAKLKKIELKIAAEQARFAKKTKFSKNWFKSKQKINRLHKKATHIRNDFAWKSAREIAKNHGVIALEDLKIKNMTASASGTTSNPGTQVAQKSGLNKSILRMAWYDWSMKLEWQAKKHGSKVIYCAPQGTSQTCNKCGHKDPENRIDQATFKCKACDHIANADSNASANIRDKASGQGVYKSLKAA